LSSIAAGGKADAMSDAEKPTREERLAAKLRENLRRRKAQSRAMTAPASDHEQRPLPKSEPGS
jgi:hypothetical protein